MGQLFDLLDKGVTPYHAVNLLKDFLEQKEFNKLNPFSVDEIEKGKYYYSPYPSMLVAFTVGECIESIRMGVAHTDFPMFRLKPNPSIASKGYVKINVEPYGGLIKETWFDRPLSLAGKVMLRGNDAFSPKEELIDLAKPIAIIPSLAPHLSDKGDRKSIDTQKEMLPIIASIEEQLSDGDYLVNEIAKTLEVDKTEILDYELYLYNTDKAQCVGINDEFLSSPRIDNLASCFALIGGLSETYRKSGINIVALFDNEEVGSRSKQGADSMMLLDLIENIVKKSGYTSSITSLYDRSFLMSVDGAHALHSNYVEKYDITNEISLGEGIALKISSSQRYLSDTFGMAVIVNLLDDAKIKYQKIVNRSGMPGGQTLGPIVSSYIPVHGVDLGIPMLAMHSAREMASVKDISSLYRLITLYFSYK